MLRYFLECESLKCWIKILCLFILVLKIQYYWLVKEERHLHRKHCIWSMRDKVSRYKLLRFLPGLSSRLIVIWINPHFSTKISSLRDHRWDKPLSLYLSPSLFFIHSRIVVTNRERLHALPCIFSNVSNPKDRRMHIQVSCIVPLATNYFVSALKKTKHKKTDAYRLLFHWLTKKLCIVWIRLMHFTLFMNRAQNTIKRTPYHYFVISVRDVSAELMKMSILI